MSDKAREEFEEVFPLPEFCRWEQDSYCWVRTRTEHPHNALWQAWLAAKEKYEPGWMPIGIAPKDRLIDIWIPREDGSGIRWSECYYDAICDQWRTTANSGNLVTVKASSVSHWREITPAPGTQGGGE